MATNPRLDRALELIALGSLVVPMNGDRSPLVIDGRPATPTNSPLVVRQWWGTFPESRIGVRLRNGAVVLDANEFVGNVALGSLQPHDLPSPSTITLPLGGVPPAPPRSGDPFAVVEATWN